MCTCIECKREFEPYKHVVVCHICDGEGYIETEFDDFMREDYRRCWQCHGHGELTVIETHLCDEDCREQYFENQFDN